MAHTIIAMLVSVGFCCAAAMEPRDIVRVCLRRFEESAGKHNDYGFVRRWERKEFNANGTLSQAKSLLTRRELVEQLMFDRLLERDGKPISEEEEADMRNQLAQLKSMPREAFWKTRKNMLKRDIEEFAWVRELVDALEYQTDNDEVIDNRLTWVMSFSPKPGYRPKALRARIFQKARGRMWIDKADSELVRVDAETFDVVNIGWGLVSRIEKGTKFHLRRRKIEPGTWLFEYQRLRLSAKVMLLKSLNHETTTRYSEYTRGLRAR